MTYCQVDWRLGSSQIPFSESNGVPCESVEIYRDEDHLALGCNYKLLAI